MQVVNDSGLEIQENVEQPAGFVRQYERNVYALPRVRTRERKKAAYLFVKRFADFVLSLVGLILLSPLFLVVAVAIKFDSRGPAFFVHKRVGQNGAVLNLYKFRTMLENADEMTQDFTPEQREEFEENYKLDDDPRLTRAGPFLRKSSLDELPQLLNILQGNLSIVGPRPLVRDEVLKYASKKRKLLSVKPGLTGWWQVNGRNNITYQERMKLELFYVDNASIWLDLKIMIKTVSVVFRKVGAR